MISSSRTTNITHNAQAAVKDMLFGRRRPALEDVEIMAAANDFLRKAEQMRGSQGRYLSWLDARMAQRISSRGTITLSEQMEGDSVRAAWCREQGKNAVNEEEETIFNKVAALQEESSSAPRGPAYPYPGTVVPPASDPRTVSVGRRTIAGRILGPGSVPRRRKRELVPTTDRVNTKPLIQNMVFIEQPGAGAKRFDIPEYELQVPTHPWHEYDPDCPPDGRPRAGSRPDKAGALARMRGETAALLQRMSTGQQRRERKRKENILEITEDVNMNQVRKTGYSMSVY